MRRFFAEQLSSSVDTVTLRGDEARHVVSVLRMRRGEKVCLIDGDGCECIAEIEYATSEEVRFRVIERSSCAAEPNVSVTLFQCLPKQGKMETIIQKCVELGIAEIYSVFSKRCIVKPDAKENKLARWNRVSKEAAKQCQRGVVPEVHQTIMFDKCLFSEFDLTLIAYENESETTLKKALRRYSDLHKIAIIIGPEGGFEPCEVERVIENGGVAVSLGKRILRTETAGMAMLAQIMFELEE